MHEALKPWQPSDADPWDFDAAAHLWRRAAFAAPTAQVEKTLRGSPAEAVARMVDGPARDKPVEGLETIYDVILGANSEGSARAWLLSRMLRADYQLREKMGLFWHNHFATSIAKVRELSWMMRQYRLFLDHGLGRFAKLVDALTRDPAMIRWLDNDTNQKGQANENYARELFELFTLGVGNYTEKDIQEAARAFTGWHTLHDSFHFSRTLHDDGTKTVLGQTGRFGGEDICRIALEQEACGRFLAGKLLRFFVLPDPPKGVVASLGDEMRKSGYDIKATLEILLGSRLFFSKDARRSIIKSPIDYLVGAARSLEIKADATALVAPLRELGQDLLAPPSVKGWPGQREWINTATWLTRVNAARGLANAFPDGRGRQAVVNRYGRALLGRPVPEADKKKMLESGAGQRDLVQALLSLPEAHLA